MKSKVTCLVVIHLSVILTAPAQEAIRGAVSVLKGVEEAAANNAEPPEGEGGKLAIELEQFKAEAPKLDGKVAAQRWLDLVTKFAETRPEMRAIRRGKNVGGRQVVAALPPPGSWKALADAIRARPVPKEARSRMREFTLQLLAASLTGDARGREKVLADIEAASAAPFQEGLAPHGFRHILDELRIHNAETPEQLVNALERRILRDDPDSDNTVQVPDLVPLFGQQRAEAFLRRALTNKVVLSVDYESETTQKLARKVAQSMVPELKVPQWSLAHSVEATELFEAMQGRFGKDDEDRRDRFGRNDYEFQNAKTYYFLGLIVQNRQDDAVKVASEFQKERNESLPTEGLRALERAGHTKELATFFRKLLASNPELPFWEAYFQLAAKAGQTDDMLAFARATLEKVEAGKTRAKILENFHRALLAADRVDEGVAELQKVLASPPRDVSDRTAPALRLMRLGVVLTNETWVNEGIAAWRRIANDTSRMWPGDSTLHELVKALVDRNRASEAETILVELLAGAVKQKTESYSSYSSSPGSAPLTALAFLYDRLGRAEDVLTLLDNAPYWGKRDVGEFLRQGYHGAGMPSEFTYFVPMLAARTLKATGRNEQALQLLNAILNTQPGNDDPYEVIVATEKTRALATLDQLFSRDMFEERPLIWKAQVLKDANRLEEAEETARQAIAIDPSDGEQGPGRRMRVYAVLADIREARGDKKEAEFLRGAVKAVRTAEEADRVHEAGLISRAVKMYQESLHFFTDAYCIQSRLAVHLAELGRHAEAEEHYRRAYELMPDSFGRVESHCFGCEHVFEGERAQTLAEKVFSQLAAKNPNKPQVHYLLGTLRQQQERLTDALKHFDDATTLDPDYLNAWVKLQTVASRLRTTTAKRDAAALNVLRLDPLQRHASPDLENISDLRALWSAAEHAQKLRPTVSTNLYPLRASAAELDKIKQRPGREMFIDYLPMSETPNASPGDILAKTAWLRTVGDLLEMSRNTMGL